MSLEISFHYQQLPLLSRGQTLREDVTSQTHTAGKWQIIKPNAEFWSQDKDPYLHHRKAMLLPIQNKMTPEMLNLAGKALNIRIYMDVFPLCAYQMRNN